MVRYRPGDMIRITALRNEASGINLPQMVFERRADDLIDFVFVRVTEKWIWEAIEHTGIPYEDWIAYKKTGETTLHVLIEFREETNLTPEMVADSIYREVIQTDEHARTLIPDEYAHMINFSVVVTFLPRGIFQQYMEKRQLEGADLAHLKPAHINPPESILNFFIESTEEIIEVIKPLKGTATAGERMVKEQINNHTASRGVS